MVPSDLKSKVTQSEKLIITKKKLHQKKSLDWNTEQLDELLEYTNDTEERKYTLETLLASYETNNHLYSTCDTVLPFCSYNKKSTTNKSITNKA